MVSFSHTATAEASDSEPSHSGSYSHPARSLSHEPRKFREGLLAILVLWGAIFIASVVLFFFMGGGWAHSLFPIFPIAGAALMLLAYTLRYLRKSGTKR